MILRRSIDRAGDLNFPFHTPFDGGSVRDEHFTVQPGAEDEDTLEEPLLDQQSVNTAEEDDHPCSPSRELTR